MLSPQVQRAIVYGSLWSYLQPRLAQDAQIDYRTIPLHMVKNGNFQKVRPAIERAVRRAVHGKLAQDADIQDLADLLNALSNGNGGEVDYDQEMSPVSQPMPQGLSGGRDAEPEDTVAKIKEFLRGQVPDDILAQLDAFLADNSAGAPPVNTPPPSNGQDAAPPLTPATDEDDEEEKAEDEVTPVQEEVLKTDSANGRTELLKVSAASDIKTAMDAAIKRERANQKAIREAERFVRPWVGELPAMDAAGPEDVYRSALKAVGVANADKLHSDALRPILEAQPKAGSEQTRFHPATLAADAAPSQNFFERFPSLRGVRVQN